MKLSLVICIWFSLNVAKSADIFNVDGSNYYTSYPDRLNWYQALRFCTYNGLYLIDVRSDFENKRILQVFEKIYQKHNVSKLNVWTSGTDLGSEGNFYWASTGHQVLYTSWDVIEPSNSTPYENCIHYWGEHDHKWNDVSCMEKYVFVCRDTFDVPVYKNNDCNMRLKETLNSTIF